jgi:hypothetical protein
VESSAPVLARSLRDGVEQLHHVANVLAGMVVAEARQLAKTSATVPCWISARSAASSLAMRRRGIFIVPGGYMQVVGMPCGVCEEKIVAVGDGTWCAACSTGFHAACIARLHEICPKCLRRRDPPEKWAVLASLCTECLHLHREPAASCGSCGSSMTYENADAYRRRVEEVGGHCRQTLLAGLALLCGGLLLCAGFWIVFVVMLVKKNQLALFGSMLLVGMPLVVIGSRKIWIARRLSRFA